MNDIKDEFYNQAVEFIRTREIASISGLQRKFKLGYNRSARLIELMEENGVIAEMNSQGIRKVIAA